MSAASSKMPNCKSSVISFPYTLPICFVILPIQVFLCRHIADEAVIDPVILLIPLLYVVVA